MNGQSFIAGFGRHSGTSVELVCTLNVPVFLEDLILTTDQADTMVSEIRVANQRTNVSNQGAPAAMWAPSAEVEGHRSLSLPLDSRQEIKVSMSAAASMVASGRIGVHAIPKNKIIPPNALGQALDYWGGLGSVSIGTGATAYLECELRRPCVVGLVNLIASADVEDLEVVSVELNGFEQLASEERVPVEAFAPGQTDRDGLVLGVFAHVKDTLRIGIKNNNAAARTVSGGFWVLPPDATDTGS